MEDCHTIKNAFVTGNRSKNAVIGVWTKTLCIVEKKFPNTEKKGFLIRGMQINIGSLSQELREKTKCFLFFLSDSFSANKTRTVRAVHQIWAVLSVFRINLAQTAVIRCWFFSFTESHQPWPHLKHLEGSQKPPADSGAIRRAGQRCYCNAAWKANAGSTWVASANLWKPVGTAPRMMESACGATGGKSWET